MYITVRMSCSVAKKVVSGRTNACYSSGNQRQAKKFFFIQTFFSIDKYEQ